MKFIDIVLLLNTDDLWITVDDDIETTIHIEGAEEGSWYAMRQFFCYTVKRITPVGNSLEIDLSSK